jgi:hypothetical protein
MTTEFDPLLADEGEKEDVMKVATGKGLKTFTLVAAIVLLVSGIILGILAVLVPATTIHLQSITTFRTGPVGNKTIDAFPSAVLSPLNSLNISFLQAFVQGFGGIGFFFLFFLNKKMLAEITYGGDGFLFGGMWIILILYNVVLAIRCGMQDLVQLFFIGTLYFAIIGIFMLGDQLNQHFYRNTMKRLNIGRFSYAFLVIAIVISVVAWGFEITALVFTVMNSSGNAFAIVFTPILAALFYIWFLIFVGLHYGGSGFIESTYSRDLWLCVIAFISVLLIPWIDVIVFSFTPSLRS